MPLFTICCLMPLTPPSNPTCRFVTFFVNSTRTPFRPLFLPLHLPVRTLHPLENVSIAILTLIVMDDTRNDHLTSSRLCANPFVLLQETTTCSLWRIINASFDWISLLLSNWSQLVKEAEQMRVSSRRGTDSPSRIPCMLSKLYNSVYK